MQLGHTSLMLDDDLLACVLGNIYGDKAMIKVCTPAVKET